MLPPGLALPARTRPHLFPPSRPAAPQEAWNAIQKKHPLLPVLFVSAGEDKALAYAGVPQDLTKQLSAGGCGGGRRGGFLSGGGWGVWMGVAELVGGRCGMVKGGFPGRRQRGSMVCVEAARSLPHALAESSAVCLHPVSACLHHPIGPCPALPCPAGDWVKEALGTLGGRGGGKPTNAQGMGPEVGKVDEALQTASSFAALKL